ncbi:MAG TPA: 50S ribosomal protein L13 [Patescibacteria group bacterium]
MDATDKVLGRLASEIAVILRGKNKPIFAPNKDIGDFVNVENAGKLKITGNKLEQKKYFSHSGYPGGLKEKTMGEIFAKDPGEILRKAVYKMLPGNKLRNNMMKRLKIIN